MHFTYHSLTHSLRFFRAVCSSWLEYIEYKCECDSLVLNSWSIWFFWLASFPFSFVSSKPIFFPLCFHLHTHSLAHSHPYRWYALLCCQKIFKLMASDTQCTTFHRCVCIWMFIFYLYFDCKPLASYSMSICLVNVSGKKDQMKRGWPKWKTTEKERSRWFWCQPTNSHASFSKWDFYHAIEIEIFQRWPFYQWPAHFTHVTLIMNDMKWPNRIKHSVSLCMCVFHPLSLCFSLSVTL